jgi:hypothetical protein
LNTVVYSLYIKNIVILDVFFIANWFILRWFIWAYSLNLNITYWLIIILFFGALWLWFLKRYQELKLWTKTRKNIWNYNEDFLKQIVGMFTSIIIVSYSMYTFNSVNSKSPIITLPFIIFWIVRYYYNIFFLEKYEDWIEDIITKDKFILYDIIITFFIVLIVIWFKM